MLLTANNEVSRLFIGEGAAGGYQGTISFQFESVPIWVHFLYALGPEGLKLEAVADANVKDSNQDRNRRSAGGPEAG